MPAFASPPPPPRLGDYASYGDYRLACADYSARWSQPLRSSPRGEYLAEVAAWRAQMNAAESVRSSEPKHTTSTPWRWLIFWLIAGCIVGQMVTMARGAEIAEPIKPQPGLTLPVKVARIVDGDTLVVQTDHTAFQWKIRLISCWAPELKDRGGPESKAWVAKYIKGKTDVLLHVPLPAKAKVNPLAHLSMERIPGYIWVGDELLNAAVVKAGHATTTKESQ